MGRYIELLAGEWSRTAVPFDRVVLHAPAPLALPPLGGVTPVEVVCSRGAVPNLVWEQVLLPRGARTSAILFCPSYVAPVFCPVPTVVANHGIYERVSGEFSRIRRLRATTLHRVSAQRAERLIANSSTTRTDVSEFFGVPEDKIDVVHPAANDIFFRAHPEQAIRAQVVRVLGAEAPYVLFVGKLARRRHVGELIEALAIVRARSLPTLRLLIVGPNPLGFDVAGAARRHGVADAVTYLEHAEQEELALLYAGAQAFVLPTTYEGISYTMFEAMASGAAVLTVEHPTLAEGAGDTALALPSPEPGVLADGLERLLSDPALRRELVERARRRARLFSWAAAASATMEILDEVALAADTQRGARPSRPFRRQRTTP
jgi:glycosyltransferase involved in cell wall biosynthesis